MTERQVVLRGGLRMSVEDAGQGEPLLMLHAGVADRHMWDRQWDWLSQEMRVIRWDWRGFGETPQVPGPFSYAEDVIAVMDALGIERAGILACSFSGSVAIQIAILRPERVGRLILSGSGIPGYEFSNPPQVDEMFSRIDRALNGGDTEQALGLLERLWLVGPCRGQEDIDEKYLQEARILLRRTPLVDDGSVSEDSAWSAENRLTEIKVPLLIVVGDADVPDTLASSVFLANTLPQAKFEMVAGAAHLPSMEKPQQFNAIVGKWLTETRLQAQ